MKSLYQLSRRSGAALVICIALGILGTPVQAGELEIDADLTVLSNLTVNGTIDVSLNRIANVAAPSNMTDAVNLQELTSYTSERVIGGVHIFDSNGTHRASYGTGFDAYTNAIAHVNERELIMLGPGLYEQTAPAFLDLPAGATLAGAGAGLTTIRGLCDDYTLLSIANGCTLADLTFERAGPQIVVSQGATVTVWRCRFDQVSHATAIYLNSDVSMIFGYSSFGVGETYPGSPEHIMGDESDTVWMYYSQFDPAKCGGTLIHADSLAIQNALTDGSLQLTRLQIATAASNGIEVVNYETMTNYVTECTVSGLAEALLRDGSRSMTGDLDMGGQSIINISTNSLRYESGQTVAERFVDAAGDTMTGALSLPAGGLTVGGNQLVTSVGGNIGIGTNDPLADLHVVGTLRVDGGIVASSTATQSTDVVNYQAMEDFLLSNSHVFNASTTQSFGSVHSDEILLRPENFAAYEGVSSPGGRAFDVAVSDDGYAYVPGDADSGGLTVFDVREPGDPVPVAHTNNNTGWWITLEGDRAYMTSDNQGKRVWIYNISNREEPTLVGEINTDTGAAQYESPGKVSVVGNYVYVPVFLFGVPNPEDELRVYDISNPASPELLQTVTIEGADSTESSIEANGYVYVSSHDGGVTIFDISNPTNAVFAGRAETPSLYHAGTQVRDDLMYLCVGGGFYIFDVSHKTNPVQLSATTDLPGMALDVTLYGDYAYVATVDISINNPGDGLFIYDVSDPTVPQLVGHIGDDKAQFGLDEWNGRLYVANDDAGLRVFDIRTARLDLETIDTLSNPAGILAGGALELSTLTVSATASSGIQVVNYDTMTNFVASQTTSGSLDLSAYAGDNIDYSNDQFHTSSRYTDAEAVDAIRGSSLDYDISSTQTFGFVYADEIYVRPSGFVKDCGFTNSGMGRAIDVVLSENGYAYVAGDLGGLWVFDVSQSSKPIQIASTNDSVAGFGVALRGDIACIAGPNGAAIFDVAIPSYPVKLSSILDGYFGEPVIAGNYLYVASVLTDELSVYDISIPTLPELRNTITVGGMNVSESLTVADGLLFVSGISGASIYDISDPTNPVFQASMDTGGYTLGIHASDGLAYVCSGDSLIIYDISLPDNPVQLSKTSGFPGGLSDVIVAAEFAYVTTLTAGSIANPLPCDGMFVYYVGDPTAPIQRGHIPDTKSQFSVNEWNGRLYVANDSNGLRVFDTMYRETIAERFVDSVGDSMQGGLSIPSGGLAVGTSQLVVSTNGNVGIGTASPTEGLHVAVSTRFDGPVVFSNTVTFLDTVYLEPFGGIPMGVYTNRP